MLTVLLRNTMHTAAHCRHCRWLLLVAWFLSCCIRFVWGLDVLAGYLDVSTITRMANHTSMSLHLNSKAKLLSDLYLFSVGPSSDGTVSWPNDYTSIFQEVRKAQSWKASKQPKEPTLKLWITIGGGGNSDHFAMATSSRESRRKLIESVKEMW